jgi:hypothetical protein
MDPTHEPRTAPTDPPTESQPASADDTATKPATPDSDTNEGSESSKGGAPRGNQNAMRHGLRSGMLPKGAEYIRRQCADFRQSVEDAVLTLDGGIGVYQASLVQSCTSHLRHALLCRKWLKDSFDALSHVERLTYSREITRALDSRDRVLKALGLDRSQRDAVTILYANEGTDGDDPC